MNWASLLHLWFAVIGPAVEMFTRKSKYYRSNGSSRTEKDTVKKAENEYTNNSKRESGTDQDT